MKRHIIGFEIFSLIIGVTFIVHQKLNNIQRSQVDFVSESYLKGNNLFEKSNVKVIQAVFNQPTKQLHIGFLYNRDKSVQEANIKLHIFVNNGKELKFLATENARTTFAMNMEQNRVLHTQVTCEWLAEIKSKENLYVWIEEIKSDKTIIETIPLNFDPSLAIPIFVDYSMDDYIEEHNPKGC
jgi:hypothetical protein